MSATHLILKLRIPVLGALLQDPPRSHSIMLHQF